MGKNTDLLRSGKHEEALPRFERLESLHPNDPDVMSLRELLLYKNRRREEAGN